MMVVSPLLSDGDDVGLPPAEKAKEGKSVQIDTSPFEAASTIRKVVQPQPRLKTKVAPNTTAVVDEEVIMDNDNGSERATNSLSRAFDKHCTAGACGG